MRRALPMRKTHVYIATLALLALALVACGGSEKKVPDNAVAVVGDQDISKTEFDALMERAKKAYEQQDREFPKAGTPEYRTLQNQAIQYLVQQAKYRQKADEMNLEISEKEVDERLKQVKQQYFGGNDQQYKKNLADQGLTEEQVRREIENQLISEKIYEKVTEGVKVTDQEIEEHYNKNKADYKAAASREVRHILVAQKGVADRLHNQLKNGGNFANLAKQHSKDPGSAENGGKLTVRKGETVPEFDKTAFELKKGELSAPVKTQYGWHIIEALTDVTPESQTPLKDVKEQIRQHLLQEKRQKAIADWSKELNEEFEGEIAYQIGYAPPAETATTEQR
jgi:foldase protein PrsA